MYSLAVFVDDNDEVKFTCAQCRLRFVVSVVLLSEGRYGVLLTVDYGSDIFISKRF